MKRILYFLGSRSLWVILGILGLIALIWFIDPLIAIGDARPLVGKGIRAIIYLASLAFCVAKIVFRHYRESRRNAALLREIKAVQEPILRDSADISSMSRQFAEIDRVLKNARFPKSGNRSSARFSSGQYLYQISWYVVLGATGSSKTTALKRSGLSFLLESTLGSPLSGLAGTRDCDWFLSDGAVLLDTTRRLSTHNEHSNEGSEDWEESVSLLKRCRPKQPINGALVTVGVDDLLNGTTNIAGIAVELRERTHGMRTKLGIDFPLYLMVTKLDLLHGFNPFFKHLTEEQSRQYFGISLASNEGAETPIAVVSNLLSGVMDELRVSVLGTVNKPEFSEGKAAAFAFPEEFERLSHAVLSLLEELSKSSKFEDSIVWCDVYFSNTMQEGKGFDPVLDGLQDDFRLSRKHLNSETKTSNTRTSLFLNKLFADIIFNETGLTGENKSWLVRNQIQYWLGVAAAATVVVGYLTLMLNGHSDNGSYLEQVRDKTIQLEKGVRPSENTPDLLKTVTFVEQIRDTTKTKELPDLSSPPPSCRMGLYQGNRMKDVGESSYQRILEDNVMPLISYRIDESLRTTRGSNGTKGCSALKTYLMMFDEERFDPEFMCN